MTTNLNDSMDPCLPYPTFKTLWSSQPKRNVVLYCAPPIDYTGDLMASPSVAQLGFMKPCGEPGRVVCLVCSLVVHPTRQLKCFS